MISGAAGLFLTRFIPRLFPYLAMVALAVSRSAAAAVACPEPVERAPEAVQRLPATATLRFGGTSTLHDFGGQLPSQPFVLVLSNGTWSASADVVAGQMATASEGRDRNMHRMLRTNDYPLIHGEVTAAPLPDSGGNVTNVALRLNIRDRTNDLPVRVSRWKETSQEIQFHAVWELSLKQYGLKPPSVAGVVRVGDRVKLEADVTASKSGSAPAPVVSPP
jgi:hypothetical protein